MPASVHGASDARLKVLHVFKIFMPDIKGGVPTAIWQLATGMQADCAPTVLATRVPGAPEWIEVDGMPVRRSLSVATVLSLPIAPFYPFRLWQMARRADVVVHHAPFPLVDLSVSLWFPRRCGLVVHWHSEIHGASLGQQRILPLLRGFINRTLRRSDRILVPSPIMIERSPFLGPFVEKCEVVPYGIDLSYWSELAPEEERRIRELRTSHPRLVVAAGRLVAMKGFDVLIEAIAGIDGQLVILGAGPLEARLRALVASHGLQARVRITGEFYDRSEFKCMLHAARIFAMPSITETFGLVQLEAMACGRAVVNTRLPTVVPLVARHGQEALTVAPGSVPELAAALRTLLEDEALCVRLGRNGRQRVAETYSEPAYLARMLQIYRAAVVGRAS